MLSLNLIEKKNCPKVLFFETFLHNLNHIFLLETKTHNIHRLLEYGDKMLQYSFETNVFIHNVECPIARWEGGSKISIGQSPII